MSPVVPFITFMVLGVTSAVANTVTTVPSTTGGSHSVTNLMRAHGGLALYRCSSWWLL